MNHSVIKKLAVLMLAGALAPVNAETLAMSEHQIQNLGIQLEHPGKAREIPLLQAPARVTIPPAQEYIVSAPQSGLVNRVEAAVGDSVSQGQVLAQINSPDLLALQRGLLDAARELRLAGATLQRDKTLLDEGVISQRRMQETQSRYDEKRIAVTEGKQILLIAGMSERAIQELMRHNRLSSTLNILAPASGVILERLVVAGQRIDMLAPVFHIANLEKLWLDLNIPQERIHEIRLGDRVAIAHSDALARVNLIGRNVNPDNQTVLVRAVINGGKAVTLRPGQTVNALLLQTSDQDLLQIPASALVRSGANSYVFVRSAEGFDVRPVEVAGSAGNHIIIRNGLGSEAMIAVTGVAALKANMLGLGGSE